MDLRENLTAFRADCRKSVTNLEKSNIYKTALEISPALVYNNIDEIMKL